MTREEKIMKRVKEHYEEACSLGKEVVAVFLQGSQNYDLDEYSDEYQSDIDTKCIILPTLDDIVTGKAPYSSTHVCANNEHIDIKDIRVMFEMYKKQNNAYIELLFTKYYYINPKYEKLVMELKSLAEPISRMHPNQALRCMAGTSAEKYKALEHPYPNTMDKINKFGYDPKQLHHILRLNDFMKRFIAGVPYDKCLVPNHVGYLMQVKKGLYSLTEARRLAYETDQENKRLKEENIVVPEFIDQDIVNVLSDLKVRFIKQFLREELTRGE
jgi:hypothetical protein